MGGDEKMDDDELLGGHLSQHLTQVGARWNEALEASGYDAGVILAGDEAFHFQDDQGPAFVPNPYLVQWIGREYALPGSVLVVAAGARPILLAHRPEDYWHAPGPVPTHLESSIDVRVLETSDQLLAELQRCTASLQAAVVGPSGAHASNELLGSDNPPELISRLAFRRAIKTEFEIERMREASRVGARGHLAAREAFQAGGSEFEIHLAYLAASEQNEHATPYPNIIAQNEHASLLHYQHQERSRPDPLLSLLIDAGGSAGGYASDITRTHVREQDRSVFPALIESMQTHQDALLEEIKPGRNYLALHVRMHEQLAGILTAHGILRCSASEAFDARYTEAFCPHGLGHLLGLQVHDVGGQQCSELGDQAPPPDNYPSLRLTREIEENQVFTIEPGLYFIPSLLAELRAEAAPVDWALVDSLQAYGGIRIEDNVRVLADGVENLTRDAFAAVAAER
jgi:Xaa-Pro dipeptidase